MFTLDQPYTILTVLSVIIPATLAIIILRQPPNLGVRSFIALMVAVALWAFISLFEVCSLDQHTKIFSYKIKFVFIVSTPVVWLTFSLYYSNRIRRLPIKHLALLLIVPLITLGMLATNPYHHWMITRFETVTSEPFGLLYPHFGPYFWFHVAYSYSLLLAGVIVLAKRLLESPAHHGRQVASLLIGGITPWLFNIGFIFKVGTPSYFDLTPIAFTVSGIAFMWGILRYGLLDIIPVARDVVIQNMKDGVIVVDNDDKIIDLNQTARWLAGIGSINVINAKAEDIIPWWSKLERYEIRNTGPSPIIVRLMVDSKQMWFQLARSPLKARSKVVGQTVTLHDVTAIRIAEMALQEREERFKSLSENAPVIIFSLDENGALDYVNPTWTKVLGYNRSEVQGLPFANFVGADVDQNVAHVFDQLINGQLTAAEINIQVIHRDGSRRLFNTCAAANSDVQGQVTGIIGLAKDVTEERKLQHQLSQSQKMEAIGTLAGGIAHDFNNLLMGMQANLSLIRMEASGLGSVQDKIIRIEDQIHSGAALTRQLLGYARKGKYTVTTFDLNDLINSTLNVVHRTNKQISVSSRLADKSAYIRADRGQMELVLLNLFLNAVDAMPQGGELSVATRRLNSGNLPPTWASKDNADYVMLEVTDTGVGMDQATQDRIFEPFFTTKEIGRGSGLGLASVYGIVKNHNGQIQVRSKPGEGSTFTLVMLASRQGSKPPVKDVAADIACINGAKILLVDDEPLILKYCSEMIMSLGFKVLSTKDSREAVDLFKHNANAIDLAILDLVMPGMDGLQLFKALEDINPQIQAIFTTGYSLDNRITQLTASGRHGFLRKPYGREELSRMINTLLAPHTMIAANAKAKTA